MITLILTLLATLTLIMFFAAAVFTIEVLDKFRELVKTASLDAVQIYAAANSAKLDAETRKEELDFNALKNTYQLEQQRDYARTMITQNRQKMISND